MINLLNLKKALAMGGFLLTFFLFIGPISGEEPWEPREGGELIGTPAPEFSGLEWINSQPLTLERLEGKAVLIRFWLTGCPFCTATAPALNELYETYQDEGLVVIGIHHPKSQRTRQREVVRRAARNFGFEFPLAMDNDWETINAYWTHVPRRFTSSTFLVDGDGIIRWVHHGGEFYREGPRPDEIRAFHDLERTIREVLGAGG